MHVPMFLSPRQPTPRVWLLSSSPVVRELQLQSSVVGGFYGDDVGAEVGSEEKAKSLNCVRLLWLASRETQLGELFVWFEHNHVRSEDNPGLLLFVVIDLDTCVVRNAEGDDPGLVTLDASAWSRTT